MPGGFLLHDGWLYVCGQGAVQRLKQSKPGGAYDVSEVVAQGFLGTGAVCGASVGPDGRLYITADYADNVVEGSDGSRATVLNTGAVFRCRPDGAKIETYAIGFVVPGEAVSFNAVGNVFHADSGYFPSQPGKFTHMRLIHVAEGADYGWRTSPSEPDKPDPYRTTMDGGLPGRMPPLLTLGTGFSDGLLIYNDTRLPENYRGLLFAADKESNAVHAFEVERKGATFTVKSQFDLLRSDEVWFNPGQPVLGPDGCIYIADSRDGTHGRIYRLTWAGTKDQAALPPRGMDSWAKIAKLGDDDLVKTLASEDGSDRDHAQRELARRGEKNRAALLKLFQDADRPDAPRIAALGALTAMWNDDVQAAALFVLTHDSSADLRRLTADAVGLNAAKGDGDVHAALLRVLNDPAPEVRRSVALAISRVAADGAADALVNAWAFDDGRDAYLRDGLVRAIENLGPPGIDRLVSLGESGVQKDTDKVVRAFTMMRTRPAADAIPRVLENPHLSGDQREALVRSYENYLLDPPLSVAPMVDYLLAHPKEDAAVKQAGAEVLAAGGVRGAAGATGWLMDLLDEKDPKVRTSAVAAAPAPAPPRKRPPGRPGLSGREAAAGDAAARDRRPPTRGRRPGMRPSAERGAGRQVGPASRAGLGAPCARIAAQHQADVGEGPAAPVPPGHPLLASGFAAGDKVMQARLTLEGGSAQPAECTVHPDQPITLGRGLDNTVVLSDKCASKLHARIFGRGDRWLIRDLGSRNGTLVNGRRVRGEVELASGAEIGFGEIRFRFTADAPPDATGESAAVSAEQPSQAALDEPTVLLADELTALYRFLSASLAEAEPHGLIRLALETLHRQTLADFVGYRGLDADDLLMVLPERERVDARLSSRMTQKALANGEAVWLADPADAELSGESLAGVRDALCVPLRDRPPSPPAPLPREKRGERETPLPPGEGAGVRGRRMNLPLGALHAYRRSRAFTERELRFCEVLAGCLAGCLRGVRDRRALEADNSRLRVGSPGGDDALVGDSPAIGRLRDQVARLADHAGSILITGETGVGKELVALGLHRASRRRHGPLVTVNCASLNPGTAVAELFGHAPGAYTGGEKAHPGFFQQADGGALFLDEVGELSPEMQAMLLRVLETRRFRPMKALHDFTVDVRVLAATNRDLAREVKNGRFRADLFYRFTVSIEAPPLREHAEDVPALARHFLDNLQKTDPRPLILTEAALERLQSYPWPGNVRQLRYVLEGAAALSRNGRIDAADLHLPEAEAGDDDLPLALHEVEAWAIRRALRRAGGEKKRAAELLGIHRETLGDKIRKYGIDQEGNGERPAGAG